MTSLAHMCWLRAAPAPIDLRGQLRPLAPAGPKHRQPAWGWGIPRASLPHLCSSGYSWAPALAPPPSAEPQVPPLQNKDDSSPQLPSSYKQRAGHPFTKQVSIEASSPAVQPQATSLALRVLCLPLCKAGL